MYVCTTFWQGRTLHRIKNRAHKLWVYILRLWYIVAIWEEYEEPAEKSQNLKLTWSWLITITSSFPLNVAIKKEFLGWVTSTSSPGRCCRWFQRQGWQPWLAMSRHAVKPAALLTELLPLWWQQWIHRLNSAPHSRCHPQHSQSQTESFWSGPGYHSWLEV